MLLVRPFDCFAAAAPSHEAAACCLKGKCGPTAKSDECCKNSVPNGDEAVIAKVVDHSVSPVTLAAAHVSVVGPLLKAEDLADPLGHSPPLTSLTARTLPLLI